MASSQEEVPPFARRRITRLIIRFEQGIVLILMAMLMVVVTLSTVELGWLLYTDFTVGRRGLILDVEEMLELFGVFLLVLIGMELLATLKSYLYERIIHVEVVLEVALIAMAQKIIIMNATQVGGPTLLGVAALILALASAFWMVRAARRKREHP